ncbi:MAG: hypothetical protein ABEI53_03220 [Candidatus Magasanikbacteria bacterium]
MKGFEESNFHKKVERDIQRLESEIKSNKKERSDLKKEELIKKSFQSASSQRTEKREVDYTDKKEEGGEKKNKSEGFSEEILPEYIEEDESTNQDVELVVEKLIDLVFHKGIFYALRKSKEYPPFIQDAFHDALVEKLVPILEERDII